MMTPLSSSSQTSSKPTPGIAPGSHQHCPDSPSSGQLMRRSLRPTPRLPIDLHSTRVMADKEAKERSKPLPMRYADNRRVLDRPDHLSGVRLTGDDLTDTLMEEEREEPHFHTTLLSGSSVRHMCTHSPRWLKARLPLCARRPKDGPAGYGPRVRPSQVPQRACDRHRPLRAPSR